MRYTLVLAAAAACRSAPEPAPTPSYAGITLLDQAPADALALDVRVVRWACTITDPDGTQDRDLRVPTGRAVRLTLHDDDSFEDLDVELGKPVRVARHAPVSVTFRIDRPDSYAWKCPVQQPPGDYKNPPTHIIASTPTAYSAYQALHREQTNPTTWQGKVALGKSVFEKKGCIACHTVDGTPRVGVSLANLWGKTVTLVDGSTRVVDAAFVADAVNNPMAIRRDGYPASMPSYEAQLRPEEVAALASYIESLR